MENTYWLKQSSNEPAFPGLIWSRPEQKSAAGKLLIIGGNAHGFSAPAEAYQTAVLAGIGTTHVLMPDSIKKLTGGMIDTLDYAPSTPSGSFSKSALDEVLQKAAWADGLLLAGDLGRNSETAILLEKLLAKYEGQISLTKDATDYGVGFVKSLIDRPQTLVVATMAQLQKLFMTSRQAEHISFDMDLVRLAELLHKFTTEHPICILTKQHNKLLVSYQGRVSSTDTPIDNEDMWRVKTATKATVWWLQNPTKTFESITTSLLES